MNPLYDDGVEDDRPPSGHELPGIAGRTGLRRAVFPVDRISRYLGNRSNSNYNSLQVTLTKRYSHGLYLLAGYTYGHAIDTATSNLAGVPPDSNNYAANAATATTTSATALRFR